MTATPIGHLPVNLYAKLNGEEIQAGTLRFPVYVDSDAHPLSLRVGPLDTDAQEDAK